MRVGTRKAEQRYNWTVRDHPHACGDKDNISAPLTNKKGSSPCVWGQGDTVNERREELRIIPMRVGTSRG